MPDKLDLFLQTLTDDDAIEIVDYLNNALEASDDMIKTIAYAHPSLNICISRE